MKKPANRVLLALQLLSFVIIASNMHVIKSVENTRLMTNGSPYMTVVNPTTSDSNFTFFTETTEVGDTFLANITVFDVSGLEAWQLNLTFDTTMLAVNNISAPADHVFVDQFFFEGSKSINNNVGYATWWMALGVGTTPVNVSSEGARLCQLQFNITASPAINETLSSLIHIVVAGESLFYSKLEPSIAFTTLDGQYDYTDLGIHDVAITGITLSETLVPQGYGVGINITAENKGNFTEQINLTLYANTTIINTQNVTLVSGSSIIIPAHWNTSGFDLGNYSITAVAAPVVDEMNTTDNTYIDGVVTLRAPIRDISILDILPTKTVVEEGNLIYITVTVENQGEIMETFNITVYANTTSVNLVDVTLSSGNVSNPAIAWNTTGFTKGNYTLSAYAWPLSGENDTADNIMLDGWIFLTILGDVNNDRIVDITDIVMTITAFGKSSEDPGWFEPNWFSNMDVNNDDLIDITDITTVIVEFGNSW